MELRVKTADEAIAEALYFRMYFSYLRRSPSLRDDYDMTVEHFKKYPQSFKILTKNDLLRLKQVQDDIVNGRYTLFSGGMDFSGETIPYFKEDTDLAHKELCDTLQRRRDELFGPLIGKIIYSSREHPTEFGPIDLVLQDDFGCVYVVEVKTGPATHAIIGQVCKYFCGISLKLILRHFDFVKMITVCPAYDEASHKGLLRVGAMPLLLKSNPLEINKL